MARQIGAQWKALDDDQREHFEALARVDKQRYLKEMEAWKAAGGDKELPQKDKKNAPGNKGATSKTTSARKSPASSPRSKKSKKKSKVDVLETPAIDNLQTILDQTCEPPSANNIPRTVSARSSISNSSAESLNDYTNASAPLANGTYNGMIEPYLHHHHSHQQPYMNQHFDFHPPAAAPRRVSEGNDGGDFLPDTLYSARAHYNGQQHSYGAYRNHWQHQSSQPSYYPYQQIAPGGVAPSSIQRQHEIGYNDDRNVSISSTSSDAKANKISPSNWNTTMGDYPGTAANRADSSNEIGLPVKNSLSSSSGSVVDVHKNSDPKWADIDDTDRLLDILGTIDDEDVKFWGTANPMA